MNFLKSLGINFLTIFFANYVLSGIEIVKQTKLPHVGGDFFFALGLALAITAIFPVMKVVDQKINAVRMAIASFSVSFAAYAILKLASLGVEVKTVEGYFFAAIIVAVAGSLTNYLEMKRSNKFPKPPEIPRMP